MGIKSEGGVIAVPQVWRKGQKTFLEAPRRRKRGAETFSPAAMKHLLTAPLLLIALLACQTLHAQTAAPAPLVARALQAVGGKEKLLKIFRIQEIFHFGSTPEPAAGKKRSTRESILSMPDRWWLGSKERGDEPAKHDVRAWNLDLLVDPASKIEALPDRVDEGKNCFGLRISGSVTPEMSLYFDQETALLKRVDWRGDYYRFSDWQEHDGVRYAARTVILKAKDDKPWFFHEVTKVERLAVLPEKLQQAPKP